MHDTDTDVYFGSKERIASQRRVTELWHILKDNPGYRSYGRAIGLNGDCDATAEKMAALARIIGVGICYYCPKELAASLFPDLESMGLQTDRHEQYGGWDQTYELAKQTIQSVRLPSDLTMVRLDAETSLSRISAIADLCNSEGVTAVPASIMRGISIPGIVFAAINSDGAPVASASSHVMTAPDNPHGRDVFWGALTTRPDRRGERIALVLGAHAIIHMWENEGARGFLTGVRADNVPSQKLCAKLGVQDTRWMMAQCIDVDVLGTAQHTK